MPLSRAQIQQRYRDRDPQRARDTVDRIRRRHRDALAAIKREAGCRDCGISDPRVLDFHHEDADEKTLAVSVLVYKRSWQAVLDEVARCIVLCANCHRIVEAETRSDVTAQVAVFARAA